MKLRWPFPRAKCPCGKDIGSRSAVIQYRYLDEESQEHFINTVKICAECADELDKESLTKKDLKSED